MHTQQLPATTLKYGDFIRVKPDAEFRAGQDAMVMADQAADGAVGLAFLNDRYGKAQYTSGYTGKQIVVSSGIEEWHVDELDISSLDR